MVDGKLEIDAVSRGLGDVVHVRRAGAGWLRDVGGWRLEGEKAPGGVSAERRK